MSSELKVPILEPGTSPFFMLCTHDHFTVDEDGLLYFVGRTDDIIKTRGEKVSIVEVENVLHMLDPIKSTIITPGLDMSEGFDVATGDEVVTSGIDGIYPKGFVIGKVDVVERSGTAYKRVVVRPAVNFAALEEVLVVMSSTPARGTAAGGPGSHE